MDKVSSMRPMNIWSAFKRLVSTSRRRLRPVAPSQLSLRDLLNEATAGLLARPGRTVLTVFGTMIGLAALVSTLGLSRTASNRIVGRFDELAATEIVVSAKPSAAQTSVAGRAGGSGGSGAATPVPALPWDAQQRVEQLSGVTAVGTLSPLNVGPRLVSGSPMRDPSRGGAYKLTITAASPGLFRAVRATVRVGRLIDHGHAQRRDRVAVLGPNAAARLGVVHLDHLTAITIGDDVYLVIAILDNVARQPELLGAVIIPEPTAQHTTAWLTLRW
jgi:macrolide transport system ATP-binding/permease protein